MLANGNVVVLTGKAYHGTRPIERADVVQRCARVGVYVAPGVSPGNKYLVASRFDTRKASDASRMGVQVISYEQFFRELERLEDGDDMHAIASAAVAARAARATPVKPTTAEPHEIPDGLFHPIVSGKRLIDL